MSIDLALRKQRQELHKFPTSLVRSCLKTGRTKQSQTVVLLFLSRAKGSTRNMRLSCYQVAGCKCAGC